MKFSLNKNTQKELLGSFKWICAINNFFFEPRKSIRGISQFSHFSQGKVRIIHRKRSLLLENNELVLFRTLSRTRPYAGVSIRRGVFSENLVTEIDAVTHSCRWSCTFLKFSCSPALFLRRMTFT